MSLLRTCCSHLILFFSSVLLLFFLFSSSSPPSSSPILLHLLFLFFSQAGKGAGAAPCLHQLPCELPRHAPSDAPCSRSPALLRALQVSRGSPGNARNGQGQPLPREPPALAAPSLRPPNLPLRLSVPPGCPLALASAGLASAGLAAGRVAGWFSFLHLG